MGTENGEHSREMSSCDFDEDVRKREIEKLRNEDVKKCNKECVRCYKRLTF